MKLTSLFIGFCAVLFAGTALGQIPAVEKPIVDMSLAKGYQLGPGDQISVSVVGERDFDFIARVNDDGKIDIPFTDEPLVAKCRTERELRSDMKDILSKYLRSPQFNLRVTERDSRPPATIYGEVNNPQQVKLMRKATLVELLALSGGVKPDEAGGAIKVFRTQVPLCETGADVWKPLTDDPTDVPSRIYSLKDVQNGKEESNPIIYPGDIIIVEKAAPVYVTGEVVQAQGVYLKEGGTTLTEAIAKVGGLRSEASRGNVKISRLRQGKDREEILANLGKIRKGLEKDLVLEPYDIIEVGKARDGFAKTFMTLAIGAGKNVMGSLTGGIGYRILY